MEAKAKIFAEADELKAHCLYLEGEVAKWKAQVCICTKADFRER
jgi:hypothetical protein